MKHKINILLLICVLFLVSCTVEAPKFTVKGVQTKQALTFLEEFQKKEKTVEELMHYIDYMSENIAPGFSWDKYWIKIREKQLYKQLTQEELDKIFSLKNKSCEQKNWVAFTDLLLDIAKKDTHNIVFSEQIGSSHTICAVWLPSYTIKSIVQFLSKKRLEQEVHLLVKAKSKKNTVTVSIKDALTIPLKIKATDSVVVSDSKDEELSKAGVVVSGSQDEVLNKAGVVVSDSQDEELNKAGVVVSDSEDEVLNKAGVVVSDSQDEVLNKAGVVVSGSEDEVLNKAESVVSGAQDEVLNKAGVVVSDSGDEVLNKAGVVVSDSGDEVLNKAESVVSGAEEEEELSKVESVVSGAEDEVLNKAESVVSDSKDKELSKAESVVSDSKDKVLNKVESVVAGSEVSTDTSVKEVTNKTKKVTYFYTEELQKILINEWYKQQDVFSWGDILSILDDAFWRDIRWINYQNKNLHYLKKTLDMEYSEYNSIKALEQDILLMFQTDNKMKSIMSVIPYKQYFSLGIVDWNSLWTRVIHLYPKKPNNKNIDALLSLYKFSCKKKDLYSYSHIVAQWDVPQYKPVNIATCLGVKTSVAKNDTVGFEEFKMFLHNSTTVRTIQDIDTLLMVYNNNKRNYSAEEFKSLMNYFSQKDWLGVMHYLRSTYDTKTIGKILDMHNHIYHGKISFLTEDIFTVLVSKKESISDLVNKHGYNKAYLNNADTLNMFWDKVKTSIEENNISPQNTKKHIAVNLKNTSTCDYLYISNLYKLSDSFNKKDVLLKTFNFENCDTVLNKIVTQQWNQIVSIVKATPNNKLLSSEESLSTIKNKYHFVGQLARVLFLYPPENLLKTKAVKQIGVIKWNSIITLMIRALEYDKYQMYNTVFNNTIKYIKSFDNSIVQSSVCQFLNKKNSHFTIQKYDPKFIISLFEGINWQTKRRSSRRTKKHCVTKLQSSEKINTLLFVLTNATLNTIKPPESFKSDTHYVKHVLTEATQMINWFKQMIYIPQKPGLDTKVYNWQYAVWSKVFRIEFIDKKIHIDTKSFQFYFAALVFKKIQNVGYNNQDLLTLISEHNLKNIDESSYSVFNTMYNKWIAVFTTQEEELSEEATQQAEDLSEQETKQEDLPKETAQWEAVLNSLTKQLQI